MKFSYDDSFRPTLLLNHLFLGFSGPANHRVGDGGGGGGGEPSLEKTYNQLPTFTTYLKWLEHKNKQYTVISCRIIKGFFLHTYTAVTGRNAIQMP